MSSRILFYQERIDAKGAEHGFAGASVRGAAVAEDDIHKSGDAVGFCPLQLLLNPAVFIDNRDTDAVIGLFWGVLRRGKAGDAGAFLDLLVFVLLLFSGFPCISLGKEAAHSL